MSEKEFIVNDYISLKLEEGSTIVYVQGKKFDQCKYLLLSFNPMDGEELDKIESIDEASEKLDRSLEQKKDYISADTEFWGHCSNLQAWHENDYDTRLLHRNIAFPLLRKLTIVGDTRAKKVFKEEIAERFASGHETVMMYLKERNYLNYLNREERKILYQQMFESGSPRVLKFLFDSGVLYDLQLKEHEIKPLINGIDIEKIRKSREEIAFPLLEKLVSLQHPSSLYVFQEEIRNKFKKGSARQVMFLFNKSYIYRLTDTEIRRLVKNFDINRILKDVPSLVLPILEKLIILGNPDAPSILTDVLNNTFKSGSLDDLEYVINNAYLKHLKKEEFESLIDPKNLDRLEKINDFRTYFILKSLGKMGIDSACEILVEKVLKKIQGGYPNVHDYINQNYFDITNYQRKLCNQLETISNTINTNKNLISDSEKLNLIKEYDHISKKLIVHIKKTMFS